MMRELIAMTATVLLAVSIMVSGCDQTSTNEAAERQRSAREEYVESTEKELDAIESEINAMQKKAEAAGYEENQEYVRTKEQLQERLEDLRQQLNAVEEMPEEDWQELGDTIDEELVDLENSVDRATERFSENM